MKNLKNRLFSAKTCATGMLCSGALFAAAGTANAADYCARHVYNDSAKDVNLRLCNTHGDCKLYTAPAGGAVAYNIPYDVNYIQVGLPSGFMVQFLFKETGNIDTLFRGDCWWTEITHVGYNRNRNLDSYPEKDEVSVNNPADGDVRIHP